MRKKTGFITGSLYDHPGKHFKKLLREGNMSQHELAAHTGLTETYISMVVNCQKDISLPLAKNLEYAFAFDAETWILLQVKYNKSTLDLKLIDDITTKERNVLKKLADIILYLQKIQMLENVTDDLSLVLSLRKLLNVSNLLNIPAVLQASGYCPPSTKEIESYLLYTWLKMCDNLCAESTIEAAFDAAKLQDSIPAIQEAVAAKGNIKRLREIFTPCGIELISVRHFNGVPVQGFIKKQKNNTYTLIIKTNHKTIASLNQALFHELGHILNGDVKTTLIDYIYADSEIRHCQENRGFIRDIERMDQRA